MKRGDNMLHLLAILLLVIFLTALSGFWLGYFLSKVITLKQVSDSETRAQDYLSQIIDITNANIEDSEIVKKLTDLINQISLDKADYIKYNESVAHQYKHQHQNEKENPNYEVQSID